MAKGEYIAHVYTIVRTEEKTIYGLVKSSRRPFYRNSGSLPRLWKYIDGMVIDYQQQYGAMHFTPGIKRDLKAQMLRRNPFIVAHNVDSTHVIKICWREYAP